MSDPSQLEYLAMGGFVGCLIVVAVFAIAAVTLAVSAIRRKLRK